MTEISVPKPQHHKPEPEAFSATEPLADKIAEAAHEIASAISYQPGQFTPGSAADVTFDSVQDRISVILKEHFPPTA